MRMIRKWEPRLSLSEWTGCFSEGEAEGWVLEIAWFGLHVEFVFAREQWR